MEFRILGPLEAWVGERQVSVPGRRQRALLAALLLRANRVVSTEQLLDDVWGESPLQGGLNSVQVRISQLRRALETGGADEPVITTRAPGYVVDLTGHVLDLHVSERLAGEGDRALERGDPGAAADRFGQALALWRGPPLSEFADAPFARAARARLDELRLTVIERRFEAELALGRHAQLVGELEEQIADNPFRERLRGQLMLALYRCGRQAEALDAYQRTRRALVDELGIEPSRPVQELEGRILRQDPALELEVGIREIRPPSSEDAAPDHRAILVVPFDSDALEALLAVAEPLTRRRRREIIVGALVADERELEAAAAELARSRDHLTARDVRCRVAAFTSENRGDDLVRLASEQDVDLLVVDAPQALLSDGAPTGELAELWRRAPCDVAVLAPGSDAENPEGPVIVPFGGGEHEWAAVEVGAWLAAAEGAPLRLLGSSAKPERGKRDASRLLAGVSLIVQRVTGVAARPLLTPPGPESVLAAVQSARLVVVGLSDRWTREGLGPARLALAQQARPALLLVRRGLRPGGLTPSTRLTRFTWSVVESAQDRELAEPAAPPEESEPLPAEDAWALGARWDDAENEGRPTRVLATLLFTDIVGSTEHAARLGDRAWKDVLFRHNELVRGELERHRGAELDTAGDGFFARFDTPENAIRCAGAIIGRVEEIGVTVRAGVHTGECELIEGKVGGIAVHIGARIVAEAGPGEVLVSSTVKDLVSGSGIDFDDRGLLELKGVPERWRLFGVVR
jgi:DNA-binding SARP family transcriptional activator/class 3 adenylate cyclase